MTLFLVLSLMLVIAVVLLVRPFLQWFSETESAPPNDVGVFKEQMRELEREVSEGGLSMEEKEDTKREIEHRALSALRKAKASNVGDSKDNVRIIGILLTIGWVTVGSALLYHWIGRPDLARPDARDTLIAGPVPGQTRPASPIPPVEQTTGQTVAQTAEQTTGQKPLSDVQTMIARLAARLEQEPGDIKGWRMLGWSHMKTQNYEAAVDAYARATKLDPDNDELLSLYAEAVTRARGGAVEPRAQESTQSLRVNPNDPRAGFLTGLSLDKDDQSETALKNWLGTVGPSSQD